MPCDRQGWHKRGLAKDKVGFHPFMDGAISCQRSAVRKGFNFIYYGKLTARV